MKRTINSLVNLSLPSHRLFPQSSQPLPSRHLSVLRPLSSSSTTTTEDIEHQVPTRSKKDSFILEKFRQRKLQGSLKTTTTKTTNQQQETANSCDTHDVRSKSQASKAEIMVSGFKELGLKEEVTMAAGELGVWVPSEIQCVGIPAILKGKSVVLSSHFGSGRTLAFFLPLVQLLRRDELLSRMKPKHPKAVVLCTTEELSDEGFHVAKTISDFARLKALIDSGSDHLSPKDVLNTPLGMLIGTPSEVVQQMDDGDIVINDIRYLVLDDADAMFDNGFSPEIGKIMRMLSNRKPESSNQGLQTVLVTDTITKIQGKSCIMERLEHDNAGKVTAMLLEINQTEVFEIVKSWDALKKKISEAIDTFTSGS